jgi:hypothetical protein
MEVKGKKGVVRGGKDRPADHLHLISRLESRQRTSISEAYVPAFHRALPGRGEAATHCAMKAAHIN